MNDTVIIHGMRDQAWKIKLAEAIRHEDGKDLQLIHELATLCANVYEDKEKYDKTWVDNKTRFPLSGWEEITFKKEELPKSSPRWRYVLPGFHWEIWKKQHSDGKMIVAFVFKGTKSGWDWYTNLRWATRFLPFTWDHYRQTMDQAPWIIQKVQEKAGADNLEIITAGHSLGGGLAHLAAYLSPNVSKVFAFNSSPVTGFYSIALPEREKNKMGKKVYRIYEDGEGLGFVRHFMKWLHPLSKVNPQIIEIRCGFSKGNPIKQHNMKALAAHLFTALEPNN